MQMHELYISSRVFVHEHRRCKLFAGPGAFGGKTNPEVGQSAKWDEQLDKGRVVYPSRYTSYEYLVMSRVTDISKTV